MPVELWLSDLQAGNLRKPRRSLTTSPGFTVYKTLSRSQALTAPLQRNAAAGGAGEGPGWGWGAARIGLRAQF